MLQPQTLPLTRIPTAHHLLHNTPPGDDRYAAGTADGGCPGTYYGIFLTMAVLTVAILTVAVLTMAVLLTIGGDGDLGHIRREDPGSLRQGSECVVRRQESVLGSR